MDTYLQSDPVGLDGGISTYGYAGANPALSADPMGLSWGESAALTWDWATGRGPQQQNYGPGTSPADEMRDAPGVLGAEALFRKKNAGKMNCGCKDMVPVTNYAAHFGLSGLIGAGLNPTRQFLGSYGVDIYPASDCKMKVIVTNVSSFKSFAYGIAPDWDRSTLGPMGNMSQTIWWIEDI
jgi:hypothetical protein